MYVADESHGVYWLGHLMDGPGKDLFPICGLANVHEFYIDQLWDKLFTCLGFFWCTCYLRSTAPGRLMQTWACQEGACEVPREIGLDFGTAEQRLRASSWAGLHFLTACGVKQSKAAFGSLQWNEKQQGLCPVVEKSLLLLLWTRAF